MGPRTSWCRRSWGWRRPWCSGRPSPPAYSGTYVCPPCPVSPSPRPVNYTIISRKIFHVQVLYFATIQIKKRRQDSKVTETIYRESTGSLFWCAGWL
jgi:hypothetical protein